MKKHLLILSFAVLSLFLSGMPAASVVVGSTGDPSSIGGGARPIGMGRAFSAIADDADAMFINPAGVAAIKGPQAMTMFSNLLEDVYYTEFTGEIPSPYGTFGLGYFNSAIGNVPTTINSTETVPADYNDSVLVFNYSSPLGRFFEYGRNIFVGVNYKIFNRGWSGGITDSATGSNADFGVKYIYNQYLSFGLVRANFIPYAMGALLKWSGTQESEESFTTLTKVGIAVKPPMPYELNVTMDYDIDLPSVSGQPNTSHVGLEWKVNKFLALRGGYEEMPDSNSPTLTTWIPSAGVSLGYDGFRFDYAYRPFYNNTSLATYYISLSYIGEPWYALKGETL
jgi:hypothetical protein